jgi:DNA repair protein RadC
MSTHQPPLPGGGALAAYPPGQSKAMPVRDQPAVRVATQPNACTAVELLSQLVAPATRKDPHALATAILDRYDGDLLQIARAGVADLLRIPGVNRKAATAIVAALTLGGRLLTAPMEKATINSPADAAALVQYEMAALEQEQLRVILLDTRNRVIEITEVYQGSVSSSQVRVGELFKAAIRRNASAILVVHCHPSGDPTPSPDDVAVTRAIVQAGNLLEITCLDHLIIGGNRWVSLKERGLGFS